MSLRPPQATTEAASVLAWSSPVAVFFVAAAAFGLLSIAIAAVPVRGQERLLDSNRHSSARRAVAARSSGAFWLLARRRWWRAQQLAIFVDRHRFDIAVFGVLMLLVAAVLVVVALPAAGG